MIDHLPTFVINSMYAQEKQAKEKKKPVPPKKPVAGAKGRAAGDGNGATGFEDDKLKERVIDVSFLDEDCLNDIVEGIKHLFER